MSALVDTRFGVDQRNLYLREIQNYLPAFLSSASTERPDPAGDVRELLNLRRTDLQRLIAVHLGLSAPVTSFATALRSGLRRPITSSIRPRVSTQAVRGSIDWGATLRERATGASSALYVVRPARRVFDTPENRALAWLLKRLYEELAAVTTDVGAADGWQQRLHNNFRAIEYARKHPWLRDVPVERPTPHAWARLRSARTSFYKIVIPDALRALQRWIDAPTAEDLTELLASRYFEPTRDWQLFELVVALRIARAFAQISSGKRRARMLAASGRGPYATYSLQDGSEIRLWYQTWPDTSGVSIHQAVRSRHSIGAGSTRPDIVIERRKVQPRMLLLELKATADPSYLGAGISQLMSYVKERPNVLNEPGCAWLVAPASQSFESAPRSDDEFWVISSDDVAAAATQEFSRQERREQPS